MSPLGAPHIASPTVSPAAAVDVLCAWPVSGQYGPGSRILYYVLVGACIIGRRVEWLRNAALAVALVFPAVAALHGLVLAAVHVNGSFTSRIPSTIVSAMAAMAAIASLICISYPTYVYDPRPTFCNRCR
jgi:hypothetical protein